MKAVSFQKKRKNIDLPLGSTNPSPSGDSWFDDADNMASVMRGIEDAKQGKKKAYTMDEIRNLLDV